MNSQPRHWIKRLFKNSNPKRAQRANQLKLEHLEPRDVPAAPVYSLQIPRQTVNEDAAAVTLNLNDYFTDPESGTLSYTLTQTNTTGLITPTITGSSLELQFTPDKYGYSYFRVTATDDEFLSVTGAFEVVVREQDDLVDDAASGGSDAAFNINVLGNDGTGDNIQLATAGNLVVQQNDTGNNTTSVTVTIPFGTPDALVRSGSNRGDYNIQIGASSSDDLTTGVVQTTISENGRNNGESTGTDYATPNLDFSGSTLFIPLHRIGDGSELNENVNFVHFTYANGWLGAFARNSGGSNGGTTDQLISATPDGGFTVGAGSVQSLGGGVFNITIPGVNSQTDGVLLVLHSKNEDNYALASPNGNGSWDAWVKDNGQSGGGSEQDPISFVYIPKNMPNVVSGRIMGDGSVEMSSGVFTMTKTGTGTYTLNIPGQSPTTGALSLSPERTNGQPNEDNTVSYGFSGNDFIIETRDIIGSAAANDPVLEDVGDNVAVASFAFIPYLTLPTLRLTSVQNSSAVANVSDQGATLSVNPDGTINYNPLTSTTIQALAANASIQDTFTYTTTTLTGQTTTATVTVTVTAPPLWFIDDAWVGLNNGDAIPDANPVVAGNQPATFGTDAFATVSAAIAAAAPGQKIVVNAGTYNEAVVLDRAVQVTFQEGDSTLTSLDDSVTDAIVVINSGVTLSVGDANDQTLDSVVTGAGTFRKVGAGNLTFNGVNTLTGGLTVDGGVVTTGIANAFTSLSTTSIGTGAELQVNGLNQTLGALLGSGTVSNNTATDVAVTVVANSDATFAGNVVQPSTGKINLVKVGTGTQTFSGANTFGNGLAVNTGTLKVGSSTALGTSPNLTVASGAILSLNGFDYQVATVAGTGTISNGSAMTDAKLIVGDSSDSNLEASLIDGGAAKLLLVKTGTGSLTLTGSSTFTGGTVISQGTLLDAGLGLGSGTVTLGDSNTGSNNVAFLASKNAITFNNDFIVSSNGTGTATIGTKDGLTGSFNTQWNGKVTLNRDVILRAGSSDRTTFAGLFTGTGKVTITASAAANRISFAQPTSVVNDFVGNVDVQSGQFQVGVNSTTINQFIPDSSNLNVASGASVRFSGTGAEAFNVLTGSGSVFQGDNAGAYTLGLGFGDGSGTFDGVLSLGGTPSANFILVKEGSGTQTFSSNSTYAGTTKVNSGKLVLSTLFGSGLASNQVIGGLGTLETVSGFNGSATVGGTFVSGSIGTAAFPQVGNLSFTQGGVLEIDILASGTAGVDYDTLNATGTINLNDGLLNVRAASGLTVGDKFTIIFNNAGNPVVGSFANGTTVSAVNNPQYTFSVSTTGGNGNDVVLTVLTVPSANSVIDVVNGVLVYNPLGSVANNMFITHGSGNFAITDSATTLALGTGAINAGWTLNGATSATGPDSGITEIRVNLGEGADTITSLDGNTTNVRINGVGSLTLGPVITTGTVTINNLNTVDVQNTIDAGSIVTVALNTLNTTGSGLLKATDLNLIGKNSLGTSGNALKTQATTLTLNANQLFVTEADGASFNVTSLGAATIKNTVGTLTISGMTSSTGDISLESADAIEVNGPITSGFGDISIAANTDGAGSEGFTQAAGQLITTNSNTSTAYQLTVNTTGGGTGNANLATTKIGNGSFARSTVTVYNGSILWNETQPATEDSGGNSVTFDTGEYFFTTTGAGGIGTSTQKFQSGNLTDNVASRMVLSAGGGGIYWNDWDSPAFVVSSAQATGGDIRLLSANAGGHNLQIAGNVELAGSGFIFLGSNDDITISPNVVIGKASGYTGAVTISGNRDRGTAGQSLTMAGSSTIVTGSTAADAILIQFFGDAGTQSTVTLGNLTSGDGGTITVNAISDGITSDAGRIFSADPSNVINAGATGTVIFRAGNTVATPSDSIGNSITPMRVTAGTVVLEPSKNANVYVVATGSTKFSGAPLVSGGSGGLMNLSTESGALLIAAPLNTDGGAITLTGAAGVTVSSALADSNSGDLTINGDTTLSSGGSIVLGTAAGTFSGNLLAESGSTFTPNSLTTVAGSSTFQSGSLLDVAGPGSTGAFTTKGLTLATDFNADLNNTTAGTGYDQLIVTAGTVDLTGSKLTLNTASGLAVNDQFTLISNTTGSAITGQFVNGTAVTSKNNPSQFFTINYAGGTSGKDVVLTLATIVTGNVLDVSFNGLSFGAGAGLANSLVVDFDGTNYTLSDVDSITLTPQAVSAGWTNVTPNSVTGPSTSVDTLLLNTGDGDDTITLNGLDDATTITGGGNNDQVVINKTLTFTGDLTISGVADVLASTGAEIITPAGTLTITAANDIGSSTDRLLSKVATAVLTSAGGDIYLNEADGLDLSATTAGAGSIDILNSSGTLNIATAMTTAGGSISLESKDSVVLSANINAAAGTISIAANSDGAGSEGFDQKAATITTTNETTDALAIFVNTSGGGTGNAIIGKGDIGSDAGGKVTVNSFGGSILWSDDPSYTALTASQVGTSNGGSNGQTLRAREYAFLASDTGTGGVGTTTRPLQIDNKGINGLSSPAHLTASVGSGGVFVTGWDSLGSRDLTTGDILATGGDIRIVSANAGGHNLFVAGNVKTGGTGNIALFADDEIQVSANVVIGGSGFAGTVTMKANRDEGTSGQPFTFGTNTSIITTNATADAVLLTIAGDNGAPSPLTVGNIAVGNGGTITINPIPNGTALENGRILQQPGTALDAGVDGTINLIVDRNGNSLGDAIGDATTPITVTNGNINFSSDLGNVFLSGANGSKITGSLGTSGSLQLRSTAGFVEIPASTTLTVPGTTSIQAGTVRINGTLSSTGGVTLQSNTVLAGSGTIQGTTTVNGELSPGNGGAGQLGTGNLLLSFGIPVNIDILGTTAGSSFDQINVTGAVDLGEAALKLNLGSYAPLGGEKFVIIANDGNDSIISIFENINEGDTITIGSTKFTLSYVGGDGNDVELTALAPIPQLNTVLVNGLTAPSSTTNFTRITSLVLTFNTAVTIEAGAFSLTNGTLTHTNNANDGILFAVNGNQVTLTFDTNVSGIEFGSLADGIWTLTTDLTKVKNSANQGGTGTQNTTNIRRLFGDVNGDNSVDGTDFAEFGNTFGLSNGDAGFNAALDFNGDDTIDGSDFAEFGNRWGIQL